MTKLYIHKVLNGGPFYDEDTGMGWIVVVAQDSPGGELYEDEVYSPDMNSLYQITRHCQSVTLEPFVLDCEEVKYE